MGSFDGVHHEFGREKAGLLSYTPSIFLAAIILRRLEVLLVEREDGSDLPVRVVFTLLFVPTAVIVAGTSGFAIRVAKNDIGLVTRLTLGSGLIGGLCFLVVNIFMDTFGWCVGAPEAADRVTVLTVMIAGSLAAALDSGATIGYILAHQRNREEAYLMGDILALKS